MSQEWSVLCSTAEVLPGEVHVAWFGEVALVVVNHEGRFHAVEDRCTHEDFELSAGPYDPVSGQIECVLHGARFDVCTGQALCPPAYESVRTYPLKVEDGLIWVREPN